MKITSKTIQEDLARAKAYYMRNDVLRSLLCVGRALRAIMEIKMIGPDKAHIDSLLRESYHNLNKFEKVKEFAPSGLVYLKGEEKRMLAAFLPLVKQVDDALKRETLEAMRARKLLIDQMIIKGTKLLAENNISEAMRCYREAVAEFKDETGLFPIITTRLIDAGYFKQSLEFSRRAILESPGNPRAYDLLQTGLIKTGDFEAGEKFINDALKQIGENAYLFQFQAAVLAMRSDLDGAAQASQKALALDPSLDQAAKILKKVNAARERAQGRTLSASAAGG